MTTPKMKNKILRDKFFSENGNNNDNNNEERTKNSETIATTTNNKVFNFSETKHSSTIHENPFTFPEISSSSSTNTDTTSSSILTPENIKILNNNDKWERNVQQPENTSKNDHFELESLIKIQNQGMFM